MLLRSRVDYPCFSARYGWIQPLDETMPIPGMFGSELMPPEYPFGLFFAMYLPPDYTLFSQLFIEVTLMNLSPRAVTLLNIVVIILLIVGLAWYKHWL